MTLVERPKQNSDIDTHQRQSKSHIDRAVFREPINFPTGTKMSNTSIITVGIADNGVNWMSIFICTFG